MGILSSLWEILTSSADDRTYVEDAKEWGDDIWRSLSDKEFGTLSLYIVNNRLYKRMRIRFRSKNIGIFTDEDDHGWINFENRLSRAQNNQLDEQGYICIKKY